MSDRHDRYIIEVREPDGTLASIEKENAARVTHPFLFSKREFSIDDLCHYASYGQGRNNPSGPMELFPFMHGIGISYRKKYW